MEKRLEELEKEFSSNLKIGLDDEKVRGFYIPLFSKFIKEKREG